MNASRNRFMPTRALTEGAMVVALCEVLFILGRYLPAGFLVAFLAAVPLALLSRRRGLKVGAVAATAALILILIIGGPSGLFIASPHAICGAFMGALLRVDRGMPSCALVGIGTRVILYPVGFLLFAYVVMGAAGLDTFVRTTRPLLETLDSYLGVVGISLSTVGPLGLFAVFLLLWSIGAGISQAVIVPLFIRRVLPPFLNTDMTRDTDRVS
jgi:hypothetical protein